jgi:CheY-like chemotaxis protein
MMLEEMSESTGSQDKAVLQSTAAHLLGVLDDMRLVVNPEQNLPVKLETFIPGQLLEQVQAQVAPLLSSKRIQLSLALGAEAGSALVSDTRRLRIALLNLIRNACLHSGGRCIRVSFDAGPDGDAPGRVLTRWVVEDDGCGIDAATQSTMFEAFVRGASIEDGCGLGLYILRRTVESLGGSIRYRLRPGGGSSFEVELAVAAASPGAAAVGSASPRADFSGLRVLLVEDDKVLRAVTSVILQRVVGAVDAAADGREALARLAERDYDLILTDYFMPRMNGLQLIEHLREQHQTVPVIGVTAATLGDEAERLRRAGADGVLEKPLTKDALLRALARLREAGRL